MRSFSSCFCLIWFFRTPLFLPWCPLLRRFLSVSMSIGGQAFSGLAAPTSRAPWGLVAGRRVLSFFALAVWTSARRRFRSLGAPFLRKGSFLFLFRGLVFPSHSEPGVFSCSRQFGLKSSQSNPRTEFGILRCLYSFARLFHWPVCVAQALLQPSCPVF